MHHGMMGHNHTPPPLYVGGGSLAAWWDAADPRNVDIDVGVETFRDWSGKGNTLAQSVDASQPSRASGALTFDGVDDHLIVSPSTELSDLFHGGGTAVVVGARLNSAANGQVFAARGGGSGRGWAIITSLTTAAGSTIGLNQTFNNAGSTGSWRTTDREFVDDTIRAYAVTYDADSDTNDAVWYINGAAVSTSETGTPSGSVDSDAAADMYLGSSITPGSFQKMKLPGLLLFDSVLSAAELVHLTDYLAARYNIAL